MRVVVAVGCGIPSLALLLRAFDLAINRPSDLVGCPINLISMVVLESVGKGDVLLVVVFEKSAQQSRSRE